VHDPVYTLVYHTPDEQHGKRSYITAAAERTFSRHEQQLNTKTLPHVAVSWKRTTPFKAWSRCLCSWLARQHS